VALALAPGDVVAGYAVVRSLGVGGMGAVYLVRHPRLPRLDALKLLRPEFSADPDFAARFLREADLVAGLSHPNIVSVLDRGEDAGRLWLTMQYVEGTDAEAALADAGGLLPADRVAHIVAGTAAALDCAHRNHLVHRDVKPANILLTAAGDDEPERVFLTDFGIAKSLDGGTRLTQTGAVLATFDYASPEQIESRPLDARSDVYSLGCVVHKLLTGSVPFPGFSVAAAIHGHLSLPPPRPTGIVPWLPPAMDQVVARAMAKDPGDRFPTCRELAAAVARAGEDLPAPPDGPYTVSLSQGAAGGDVAPTSTAGMPREQTERLVELVRRTRFFDLPEDLHRATGRTATGALPHGGRPVTLEIRSGATAHRVVADLDEPRRPPELDDLVATIQQVPAHRSGAPPTAAPVAQTPAPPTAPGRTPPTAPGTTPPVDRTTGRPAAPPTAVHRLPPAPPWIGPGAPGPPGRQTPAPPPSRRGRSMLVALLAVVLVAAGLAGWWILREDDPGGNGGPGGATASSPASPTLSAAEEALRDLPRSAEPLADAQLVVPRAGPEGIDLVLVDSATGEPTGGITTSAGDDVAPIVSPDRRSIAFARVADGAVELRVVAADGSGDSPLFTTPPTDCDDPQRPAWNPADPTQLAVLCTGTGERPDELRVVALDGSTVRTLETGHTVHGDVAFSPDGRSIGYWAGDDRALDGGDLFAVAADGSAAPVQLTEVEGRADADLVWSPDGTRIAYRRVPVEGESRIFVMAADGSQQQALTPSGAIDQDPTWSPDGTELAFKSDRAGPHGDGDHIWITDDRGRELQQLPTSGAPDSHAVAWGLR
jgi:hypothetical protein